MPSWRLRFGLDGPISPEALSAKFRNYSGMTPRVSELMSASLGSGGGG